MALHNDQPDTERLDRLAASVLRAALAWGEEERKRDAIASDKSTTGYVAPKESETATLQQAVDIYAKALVDETIPASFSEEDPQS